MSFGDQLIERVMEMGVSFYKDTPTCWHFRKQGEDARTAACCEWLNGHQIWVKSPTPCIYQRCYYSELYAVHPVRLLAKASTIWIYSFESYLLRVSLLPPPE